MNNKLKLILKSVIKSCNKNKFYADRKLSKTQRSKLYKLASGSHTIEDLIPAFNYLFEILEDNHAHIRDYKTSEVLAGYRSDKKVTEHLTLDAITNQKFESKRLNKNIGYLKIVGIHPKDKKSEAKKIRNAILELSNQKIENWIIDLRYNTGGHFESMICGLSPLLKDGILATIVSNKKKIIGKAKLKNRKFSYFKLTSIKLPKHKKVKTKRIAILTSKYTASSGELVAVCFKGVKNTRFFGEGTAGKTTNTSFTKIKNKLILLLSTGYFCDRNKISYTGSVPVDKIVIFTPSILFNKDPIFSKVKDWYSKC